MERNIEHEVITALAEKDINLTVHSDRDGYRVCCVTDPKSYDKMELHEFQGKTLRQGLQKLLDDPKFMGTIDSGLILSLSAEQEQADEAEIIDTFSITNPYLQDLKISIDKALQAAAKAISDCDTATITAKVVLSMDDFAPDFANDAKMFNPAQFAVNVGIKRDLTKYSGCTKHFVTRVVDGRMLLVDPDRQITLDEAIKAAEAQTADVPVDDDEDEPDGDPEENDGDMLD